MSEYQLLFDILSAGGDSAVIAIAFAIWRLDRRVFRLELLTAGEVKNEKKP